MGDTSVDIFLETLNNLITGSNHDFIIKENHQLQSLAEEIKELRGFLKITEKKRNEYQEVMDLVMRIRDVVSESENIVELFVVHAIKADDHVLEHEGQLSLDLESVKKEIKNVRAEVKHILDENMYDIKGVAVQKPKHSSTTGNYEGIGSTSLGGRNTYKFGEEKVVLGFKDEVKTLMQKLHDRGDGGRLEIISIIGTGGGGKTTLAREVYDHPLTLEKFEVRAWVNVSQDYRRTMKKDFLISILKSVFPKVHEDYKKADDDKLGEEVYKCLKGKKYFIVMDDIWDLEAWNDIQRSFPRECNESKVLFTSRQPVQPNNLRYINHCVDPLSESCSWELLEKKVFKNKKCPLELVDIGMQIAKKCKGLPLAVVAIAGILTTEDKTVDVWKEVSKHISSSIVKNQEGCMEILELSYNHLPLHLKACFLYIGAHPEDHEIPVQELIWLWIAEGLIQQSEGVKSLEALGEDYLTTLKDRNLIMVARRNISGTIEAYHIHDLLRELSLKKGKEDNFSEQIYGDVSFSISTKNTRRLFIAPESLDRLSSTCEGKLRSFLCPTIPIDSTFRFGGEWDFSFIVENFELLRVFHFYHSPAIGEIRKGDLVHLRYLALRLPIKLELAPYIFLYLSNLEILNLICESRQYAPTTISLPRDIFKMVKLRHLFAENGTFTYHDDSFDEEGGNALDSLQTLHGMGTCERCLCFLKRTPNVTKLSLEGDVCTDSNGDSIDCVLPDLEFLKCLEILCIRGWDDEDHTVSTGLKLPSTIKQLTLSDTYLNWDQLSTILQNLPSLELLKLLFDACDGPVWNTSELEEGFPRLKYLIFYCLGIEEWKASEDQFPSLEVLVIEKCRKLKGIPIEFGDLLELREIKLVDSQSAVESAEKILKLQRDIKGDDACVNLVLQDDEDQYER